MNTKPLPVPFRSRLAQIVAQRGNVCVGVDPHPALVEAWGQRYDVAGVERVARGLVDALGPLAPVFKPQAAFFECLGPQGMTVLARVLSDIAEAGALAILDVKRGDIGSTMEAYAQAYLCDGAELAADAITVSPYLGFGALAPAVDLAHKTGRGVYVLCRTSNPEGAQIQQAVGENGVSVAQNLVNVAQETNVASGLDAIGLVVGATHRKLDIDLAGYSGSILAPGIGVQGGNISELEVLFGTSAKQVLPSVSRQIMKAGPDPESLRLAFDTLKVQI